MTEYFYKEVIIKYKTHYLQSQRKQNWSTKIYRKLYKETLQVEITVDRTGKEANKELTKK
jgi:hypothetical protein